MRERIRWRIARLVDRLPGQCWVDQVEWALGHKRLPGSSGTRSCREDMARVGACYCGKFRKPGVVGDRG